MPGVGDRINMNYINLSALSLVRGYQKYISPHKGFICAHRALYGGPSCSQFFYESIINNGLYTATINLYNRGKDCRAAAMFLATAENHNPEKDNKESRDQSPWTDPTEQECRVCAGWGIYCCFPW